MEACLQIMRKKYFQPGIYGQTVYQMRKQNKDIFSNIRSQNIYLQCPHSQQFFKV